MHGALWLALAMGWVWAVLAEPLLGRLSERGGIGAWFRIWASASVPL